MDDLVQFLRDQYDDEAEDVGRGYLKAREIPNYHGWDKSTTTSLPPAVAVRVLREIEAKRQAVDACAEWLHASADGIDPCAASVLAALALPYADHPDYQDTWRP